MQLVTEHTLTHYEEYAWESDAGVAWKCPHCAATGKTATRDQAADEFRAHLGDGHRNRFTMEHTHIHPDVTLLDVRTRYQRVSTLKVPSCVEMTEANHVRVYISEDINSRGSLLIDAQSDRSGVDTIRAYVRSGTTSAVIVTSQPSTQIEQL